MKRNIIKIKEIIKQHIKNNKREYIIVTLIFITGIFLGVLLVNNIKENQQTEITEYLNNFIDKMKTTEKLDNWSLLKTSLAQNLILGISIWFFRNYCNRNTNSNWKCIIKGILFWLYGIYVCKNIRNVKGINIYNSRFFITKYFINTSNIRNSS